MLAQFLSYLLIENGRKKSHVSGKKNLVLQHHQKRRSRKWAIFFLFICCRGGRTLHKLVTLLAHLCDDPEREEVPDPRWREKVSPDRFDLPSIVFFAAAFRYSNKVFLNDSEVLYSLLKNMLECKEKK
ncbi:hypothetical protein CEXT_111531 [Caerostris extrusa]|uniref:Uncharacterized protein n=1 Tax=Caerostris extrusa TaxID=172846 RepID=A0AAV4RVQ4_CAEEX|nr:hypothetical protein CEXT_111531 [Caerostris extrusa]